MKLSEDGSNVQGEIVKLKCDCLSMSGGWTPLVHMHTQSGGKLNFKDDFKELKDFNDSNHIFIVGLPRSGSTLIETIISHNAKKIVSVEICHSKISCRERQTI